MEIRIAGQSAEIDEFIGTYGGLFTSRPYTAFKRVDTSPSDPTLIYSAGVIGQPSYISDKFNDHPKEVQQILGHSLEYYKFKLGEALYTKLKCLNIETVGGLYSAYLRDLDSTETENPTPFELLTQNSIFELVKEFLVELNLVTQKEGAAV